MCELVNFERSNFQLPIANIQLSIADCRLRILNDPFFITTFIPLR